MTEDLVAQEPNVFSNMPDWALEASIASFLRTVQSPKMSDLILQYINEKQNRFFKTLEE